MTDQDIRGGERLMDPCFRQNDIGHLIIFETNHGIRELIEAVERLASLRITAPALERKWKGHKAQHKRTGFARKLGD